MLKALYRPKVEAKRAADGISFRVDPGEMVGHTGCGSLASGAGS